MSLEYPNPEERNINSTDSKPKVLARLEDLHPIIDKVNEIDANSSSLPYKVYTALLNQSGAAAPVPTILEDAIGGGVWTRVPTVLGPFGQFDYKFTPTIPFNADKTFISPVVASLSGTVYGAYIDNFSLNDNCLYISTVPNSSFYNTAIEIKVYA